MTDTGRAIAGTLLHVETRPLATRHGALVVHVCRDLMRRTYVLVIAHGDVRSPEPLLARVHSSCVTSETFGGCDCDCAEQLDAAVAAIAAAGRGVVFYLDQEGRGAGFTAKVRDRMLVQASGGRLGTFEAYAQMGLPSDLRTYEAVPAARRALGITAPLRLLTNNPEKLARLAPLVPLAGTAPLALPPSPFNRHYLAAKAAAGHRLAIATCGDEAALPGLVEVVAPQALAGAPHLVRLGAYWLPVRPHAAVRAVDASSAATPAPGAPDTMWLQVHAYVDVVRGRERVVLVHGAPSTAPVLVRVQCEALLERLPSAVPGREHARWLATLAAFAAAGGGIALMRGAELGDGVSAHPAVEATDLATDAALVGHHAGRRLAIPLEDDEARGAAEWRAALAAAGVAVGPARALRGS